MQTMQLAKTLTPEQKEEAQKIKDAYCDFWNNIKFRKGWAKPLFTRFEVDHLLTEASEIVTLIRSELDRESGNVFKMRMIDGNAREFLWTVTSNPTKFPVKFVRDLVHATFQDGSGYVEGLSREVLDEHIDKLLKIKQETFEQRLSTLELVKEKWDEVNIHMKNIVLSTNEKDLENKPKEEQAMQQILSKLTSLNSAINALQIQREEESEEKSTSTPGVESSDDEENKLGERPLTKSANFSLHIDRLADGVDNIKSEIQNLKKQSSLLDVEKLKQNPRYGEHLISELNKKCMSYAEDLKKDLQSLDKVVSSQDSLDRQREVKNNIQNLLEDVENIRERLNYTSKELNERERRQREAQEKERIEKERLEKDRLEKEKLAKLQKLLEEEKKLKEEDRAQREEEIQMQNKLKQERTKQMWRAMKFDPKFQVDETRDKYIISSYIPGLNEEDIKVNIGKNNSIVISGYKEPSPNELEVLHRQLAAHKKRTGSNQYFPSNEDNIQHLLRLGAGHFGNFSKVYQIDQDEVDINKMSASYENGVLRVIVPKRVQPVRRMPSQYGYGYPSSYPNRFFSDNDLWF